MALAGGGPSDQFASAHFLPVACQKSGSMAPSLNVFDVSPGPVNTTLPGLENVVFFSPYQRKGVIVMAVAGLISCTLVSVLLLYIIFSALSLWRRKNTSTSPFLKKQVAVFVICLLASDLIQSISGVLQMKWAMKNRIYKGSACTAQAATLVMGDLASTVWSSVIAAHTFSGLALGKHWPKVAVYATVIIGWAFVVILTVIGPIALEKPNSGPFFGIAGDWCFITSDYAYPRLVIHYVPLFVAAVIILVFYGLVFLVLRGSINFSRQLPPIRPDDVFLRERIMIAKRMLWYPIAYLTCIFPIATIRLVGLREETIPDSVWIFGMFFLFLLGAIDAVIYTITRNVIKPIRFSRGPSNEVSTARTENTPQTSPRKSGFSDIDSGEIHRALDLTQYAHWDKEAAQDIHMEILPPHEQEVQPSVTEIHVTLERIEEVI